MSPPAAAAGADERGAEKPRSAWAIVGVTLLGLVFGGLGRCAGASAVRNFHWRDPALVKTERSLERELARLRSMEQSLGGHRATAAEDDRALRARAAVLERAVAGLEGASAAAGLELEARLPSRQNGSWTSESIRVRAGGDPTALAAVVARLSLPEGVWVEGARCSGAGCSLHLTAATWAEPPRPTPALVLPPRLPPRPWWPPSAAVWDRLHQASEEVARLGTVVGELHAMKQVHDAGTLLETVTRTAREEGHRAAIARVVDAAVAAGIAEVEVQRVDHGVHVRVPQPSAELQAALEELGQVVVESRSDFAVTYALVFVGHTPRPFISSSALPAGLSLTY